MNDKRSKPGKRPDRRASQRTASRSGPPHQSSQQARPNAATKLTKKPRERGALSSRLTEKKLRKQNPEQPGVNDAQNRQRVTPAQSRERIEKNAPSLLRAPRRKANLTERRPDPEQEDPTLVTTEDPTIDDLDHPDADLSDEESDGDHDDSSSDDVGMLGIGSPIFPPSVHNEFQDQLFDNPGPSESWDDSASVEARIRELQERLDGLMAGTPDDNLDAVHPPAPQRLTPENSPVESAREVLQSEYYRRNWGRNAIRQRTFDVDDFGLDPDFEEQVRPAVEFLFKRYFRVEVDGIRNVPDSGRAVIVANHSGALPWDGVMLREAIRTRHKTRTDFRWLAEDFSFYLPFLGVAINRMGAVRACPENASRLLEREHLIGVFPEGAEGTKKLFRNRYRLQRFGRGGFVRLCLQTQSPIVPCAIVGAEETNPILYRFDNLSKLLGLDYLPVTPTFPWLGPLGLIPAPTKWRIIFGEPISVAEYGPEAAVDHVLVGRIAEQVRTSISNMLDTALRRRKSVWLG